MFFLCACIVVYFWIRWFVFIWGYGALLQIVLMPFFMWLSVIILPICNKLKLAAATNIISNSYYFSSRHNTKSLTAEPSKHFKAANGQLLTFAPGEIYKHVKIDIMNEDDTFEGNKTFQVIFSSDQRFVILTGPREVNVTVMYTKGKRNIFSSHWTLSDNLFSRLFYFYNL